ncbi:neuraminidase-like domain-containing protein [Agrococcus sp. DT81.2]|uniref:neuraminidase-like domain-containing protein n=1 Tax=Agrococcus sp. DT81.2 TaxID=3393414 RepID=UPI003CE527C9
MRVSGLVLDLRGVARPGLQVEALDRDLDGTVRLGSATTDADGRFVIEYDLSGRDGKQAADLELQVVDQRGGEKPLARTATRYSADVDVELNVAVDAAALASLPEHVRLRAAIAPILGDRELAGLDPEAVSYLAHRSGWDPRLIAMAAQAEEIEGQARIPAGQAYALLRAGLPSAPELLASVSDDAVLRALDQAQASGVVEADPRAVKRTLALHKQRAESQLLRVPLPGATSSLDDMLSVRLDEQQKQQFVEVFRGVRGDPERLWGSLGEQGFDERTVAALQTDAVLGGITRQNAPVVRRLVESPWFGRPADMAVAGLYEPKAWDDLVGDDVPAGLTKETYLQALAAQVDLRYPTHVAAALARRDELRLGPATEEVAGFLTAAADEHTIGRSPVKRWTGFEGLGEEARAGVLRLERLYQITPTHEATLALAASGIGSAREIVSMTSAQFVAAHAQRLGGEEKAIEIHRRAQTVHAAAVNLAVTYLTQRTTPPVYAVMGAGSDTGNAMVIADESPAATLEALFGAFEYCDCSECRSVLGPAAYLVELLELLDVSDDARALENPLTVLLDRRPDLQHLQLSCENTTVALPYIDVVNEILEHSVVHGSLTAYTGHDVAPDAETADLLADPQFVEDAAYTATASAVFPYELPFDMPLASLRLLLQAWDTTLADALLAVGDVAGSRRERLGLNAGDLAALTSVADHSLAEHLGEPVGTDAAAINASLGAARQLTRRLGIDYLDLTALLRTETVNPAVSVLAAFEATGLGFAELRQFIDGSLTAADVETALPAGLDRSAYGNDVPAWLTAQGPHLLRLVVLAGPNEAAFGDLRLRYADPSAADGLDELTWHLIHRFIRLQRRTGHATAALDRLLTTHFGVPPGAVTLANLDDVWTRALRATGAIEELFETHGVSARARADWLALWPERTPGATPTAQPTPPAPAERRLHLARLLKAGSADVATLIELSGADPFADDLDQPSPSLLRFVALWKLLKSARLKLVDLDYLLRHHDQVGGLVPTEAAARAGFRNLRDALAAVDAELAVATADPDLTSAVTRVGQLHDPITTERFFGLLDGGIRYTAPLVSLVDDLPAPVSAVAPGLAIDAFDNVLAHVGIMPPAVATDVKAAADALTLADVDAASVPDAAALQAFVTALKAATDALVADGQADVDGLAVEAPALAGALALAAAVEPAERPAAVMAAILPELRRTLRAGAVRAALGAVTGATPEVLAALIDDPAVMPALGDASRPVLDDLLDASSPVDLSADGIHEVLLDPPSGGDVQLWVSAPEGTTVALAIGPDADSTGVATVAVPTVTVGAAGEVRAPAAVAMPAGRLALATLTVAALPAGGTVRLAWRTRGTAREPVPAARIASSTVFESVRTAALRVSKAVALTKILALTPAEIRHLGGIEPSTKSVFAALAVDATTPAGDVRAQLARVRALAWFVALRAEHEPDPDTLVGLLREPARATPQGTPVLAEVLGWSAADVPAALTRAGLNQGDLGSLANLERIAPLFDLLTTTLQPALDLFAWVTAAPTAVDAAGIRASLRARLGPLAWRETLTNVNDTLRTQRRDALVAHVLHHDPPTASVRTADQLYEHLLVDVQMGSCASTSRIRLALSSVQLFVTRCLLGLEPRVDPGSIDPKHWSWMQRYRVWEANRRVFLHPENWLEPELRPDKSPFFRELEGDLLKADITDELAEEAYLSYLKKLDDVAKLEIVGAWLDQRTRNAPGDDVLYVVGRTNGSSRQHYLRRREGRYWTPWEKISLPISGDIVLPVVWKQQLYIFWVQAMPKPDEADRSQTPSAMGETAWGDNATTGAEIGFGWGEYYRGRWTSPKSSELSEPVRLTGLEEFDASRLVVLPHTERPAGVSERLVFDVYYRSAKVTHFKVTFTSKHRAPHVASASTPAFAENPMQHFRPVNEASVADRYVSNALRRRVRTLDTVVDQPPAAVNDEKGQVVFTKSGAMLPGFSVRPLLHPVEDPFEVPFFYDDEHATFWVTVDATTFREDRYYFDLDAIDLDVPLLIEKSVLPDKYGPVIKVANDVLPQRDAVMGDDVLRLALDETPDTLPLAIATRRTVAYRGVELDAEGIAETRRTQ